MTASDLPERLLKSRNTLYQTLGDPSLNQDADAAEGGCGVVGLAANFPVRGIHLVPAATQMHNRGNGKGGGIAAAGLDPAEMGVSPEVLRDATLLQIALLDPSCREALEAEIIEPAYEVIHAAAVPTLADFRQVPGLDVRPPDVWRYFVRARQDRLAEFAKERNLTDLDPRRLEDEFIYQTSFRLNHRFYASLGEKQAFVLSHGRDLMVFKIVGFAEQAAAYYRLNDLHAHVWIAHQRYPTKGRVWHPGGAHPFIGLNEALVHNGDFANYHATCTYLRQRNIVPLFLTDTEVSALLFDLWDRVYQYPLEVIIEALAPTTERDFDLLPPEKQRLYRAIQQTHIQASPDGPWFFIIARSQPDAGKTQLLGITDTSMLRPQVFALSETALADRKLQIGLIASEKQAIDATLESLHRSDPRIPPAADHYWNARGGSHTDGGAFSFTVERHNGQPELTCRDKFDTPVAIRGGMPWAAPDSAPETTVLPEALALALADEDPASPWPEVKAGLEAWQPIQLEGFFSRVLAEGAKNPGRILPLLSLLTRMRDWPSSPGTKRKAALTGRLDQTIHALLDLTPRSGGGKIGALDWDIRDQLHRPGRQEDVLVVNVTDFPPEGEESAGRFIANAAALGWRHFITYGWKGQRFCGCGLGPGSRGVCIDVYGASGDYLGSGLDGAEIVVHGDAQDQVGQILNAGKLVIHGSVGQTFMYGAKGGQAYVRGHAAGRPLINAVGAPRVVINGTCLDYLAESFMAGDPLNGGGFVILNGIRITPDGQIQDLDAPYPGGNLFSLASGGAIYIRDPHQKVDQDQLNGGHFVPMTEEDWALIEPYLQENARLFDIPLSRLLSVDGKTIPPTTVYRKVAAVRLSVLT
jgi:glutamate synthase domain-containing protein 1/glutamate synthase domain-containing protein 3